MRVETFAPVVQYALINVLKQMQIFHQYQGRGDKFALFPYKNIKSFRQFNLEKNNSCCKIVTSGKLSAKLAREPAMNNCQ
jgi:hypothetical protein